MKCRILRNVFCLGIMLTLSSVRAAEPGISDTEIVIGAHTIESGVLGQLVEHRKMISAYFDRVNKNGGIHGRKIKFINVDTQGVPTKTVEATKQLVEQDHIFAMVGSMGFAHQAVYKYLAEKEVPDLFFHDLLSIYYKPAVKTIFPYFISNSDEGKQTGEYIAKRFPDKKACFLKRDSAASAEFKNGVVDGIGAAKSKMVIGPEFTVDRTAIQANAEVFKLKEAKCDIVFADLVGGLYGAAINFGASQGFKPKWVLWGSGANKAFSELVKGDMRNGIISSLVYATNEKFGVPGWKDYLEITKVAGTNSESLTSVAGYSIGEMFVEALKRAGKDITREKLLKAVEGMNGWKCGLCLAPLQYSATDHSPFKSVTFVESVNSEFLPIK